MSYCIVIFNNGSVDHEILTDDHGHIQEFADEIEAENEAEEWLDDDQYRDFEIFERL